MIGDWVRWNNKNVQIAAVSGITYSFGHQDLTLAHCNDDKLLETHDIKSVSPIPLTPEILEKNGFVKEKEERGFSEPYCVYVCDDFQYVIKIYPKSLMDRYSRLYIGEDDDNENVSLLINYLHELQHALRLCGIEKNIII